MRILLQLSLAAALVSAGPAFAAEPAKAYDAANASMLRGSELAKRNCSMCHAIGPQGASINRAAPPFRTLATRYPLDNLQEALAEGILTGHPAMPEFRFTPAEINDLIGYLKSLQPASQASNAGRGRYAR